jgi:hypothetical protein
MAGALQGQGRRDALDLPRPVHTFTCCQKALGLVPGTGDEELSLGCLDGRGAVIS